MQREARSDFTPSTERTVYYVLGSLSRAVRKVRDCPWGAADGQTSFSTFDTISINCIEIVVFEEIVIKLRISGKVVVLNIAFDIG